MSEGNKIACSQFRYCSNCITWLSNLLWPHIYDFSMTNIKLPIHLMHIDEMPKLHSIYSVNLYVNQVTWKTSVDKPTTDNSSKRVFFLLQKNKKQVLWSIWISIKFSIKNNLLGRLPISRYPWYDVELQRPQPENAKILLFCCC